MGGWKWLSALDVTVRAQSHVLNVRVQVENLTSFHRGNADIVRERAR